MASSSKKAVRKMAEGGMVEPDPNDSNEWDRIRNWVGAQEQGDKRHPAVQMLSDGGEAGGFDVGSGDSDTLKAGGAQDDPGSTSTLDKVKPFIMNGLKSGLEMIPGIGDMVRGGELAMRAKDTLAPPSAAAEEIPATPENPLPDVPRGTPPAPVATPGAPAPGTSDFEAQADKILGSSPDARKALFQHLQKANMWSQIPALLSGFGDAIAKAGGDTSANHMGELEKTLGEQDKGVLENADAVSKFGTERYKLAKELQADDPRSPYSKLVQNSYRGVLKSMGASDAEISSMSGSLAGDVAQKRVTLTEALARIQQEGTYQRGMLANAEAQRKQQGAEFKAQHPILSKLSGFDESTSTPTVHGIPDVGHTFNGQKIVSVKKVR